MLIPLHRDKLRPEPFTNENENDDQLILPALGERDGSNSSDIAEAASKPFINQQTIPRAASILLTRAGNH